MHDPNSDRVRRAALDRVGRLCLIAATFLAVGCGIGPKNFRSITHPAGLVRARSAGLSEGLPEAEVVPALIARLDDTDPVVRLTAFEELKRRTGQDFGYLPWTDHAERERAIGRWRSWWDGHKPALARSREMP